MYTCIMTPVSDRFVVRNKEAGSIGITLHESTSWDALTANQGTGNLLNAMGLAAISANYTAHNTANNSSYLNGTYVSLAGIGGDPTTFWQALQDAPTEDPSTSSTQWRQVIPSVGRAMVSELGQNSTVRVNKGDLFTVIKQFLPTLSMVTMELLLILLRPL